MARSRIKHRLHACGQPGIRTTKSRVIALVNDDVWLEPTWLESMLETQRKTKADMVASTVLAPKSSTVSWPIKPAQWQLDSCGFDFAWRGKAWPLLPDADGNLQSPLSNAWDNWLQHIDMLGFQGCGRYQATIRCRWSRRALYSQVISKIGPFKRSFFCLSGGCGALAPSASERFHLSLVRRLSRLPRQTRHRQNHGQL